ncbi:hypothetical protein H5410_041178 [Solanum commersonii]|uniref:Uncharacterized protein n=1 Tax=Solanum commersonii TaxID=4109 RepID=A0A9J5XU23_SOLCO|nr:hypothetical protein H5410_041178 [Solanum commersonii]
MQLLGDPKLLHTYREKNKIADFIAKEGAKKRIFEHTRILQVPPMFANEAVWVDKLGTTYPREISTHNSNLITTRPNQKGLKLYDPSYLNTEP